MKRQKVPLLLRAITPAADNTAIKVDREFSPVFILSTGRTATNFLANYLDYHPQTKALHEPKPSRILRLWSNAFFENKVAQERMKRVLETYRSSSFFQKNDIETVSGVYVESNPFLVGFAGVINEVFPESKVVHIVRDPRTYVPSILNHGNTRGVKKVANKFMPFWQPKLDLAAGMANVNSDFERYCAYWTLVNKYISYAHSNRHNYKLIRFEDLFSENKDCHDELLSFIGISMDNVNNPISLTDKLNRSKRKVRPEWDEWLSSDIETLNRHCSALMNQYGYGQERRWQNKIELLKQ